MHTIAHCVSEPVCGREPIYTVVRIMYETSDSVFSDIHNINIGK